MALRAVLFDFGDTLLSTRLDWPRVLQQNADSLVEALRPLLPGLDFPRLQRDFLAVRGEGKRRAARKHVETPATLSLERALGLQGVRDPSPGLLQAGVDAFFAPEEAAYSILTGVPEALARLRALGLRLGVVSNATCGQLIRRALARRGLLYAFELVVVSAEEGMCKPEPELMLRALARLGVAPGAAAMVGDRLETDVLGAGRAGLRSVLADFFGDGAQPVAPAPVPDAIVRHPEALVPLCRSWMR
ncbi:MAG TPA: HAD family hydrolase [Myxococcota bacterium]|nr:HAD family hydrolase [Myxococcota bacterium]HRY92004.1 HAD family hydrolase [Myxococcota bacterium]HSA22679.1 HAD family hydrolase [Myxococcota bacterium]